MPPGGRHPLPSAGEIILSLRGVLFLDELPESNHTALESLRQPLGNKVVAMFPQFPLLFSGLKEF